MDNVHLLLTVTIMQCSSNDCLQIIVQRTIHVLGSIGCPLRHTEIKVVDAETDEVLPPGSKGIVKARGPQVMKGYYKNPSATKQVLDEDGWLNTGDIGWIAPHHSVGRSRHSGGIVFLEGRAKDTIVLSTGENVEPSELEEAAMRSSLIQQIVVIGQDQRRLGAIIVPNKEELLVRARNSSIVDFEAFELSKENTTSLVYDELRKWTSECSFQIGPILIDSGLMTPTMKIRRDRVIAQYKDQIQSLYNHDTSTTAQNANNEDVVRKVEKLMVHHHIGRKLRTFKEFIFGQHQEMKRGLGYSRPE
ncbi:hypothetical protein LguiA_029807 [Lonicera macranthoides]